MKLVVITLYLSLACVLSDSSSRESDEMSDSSSRESDETSCNGYIRKTQRFQDKILTQCSGLVDCGPPESIANGNVSYTSTTLGSLAIYTCDTDYLFTGSPCDQEAVCGVSERWSGPRGTCEYRCGTPPSGESVQVDIIADAVASYSCVDENLVIAGPCEAVCERETGMWSAVGPCVPVTAGCPYSTTSLVGAYELDSTVYVNFLFCPITIMSPDNTRPRQVYIKFIYFNVELGYDYLYITVNGVREDFNGDLGSFTLTYTTTGDIAMSFETDSADRSQGFFFTYNTIFIDEL